MDILTGEAVAKAVIDLAKNENVLNKSVGLLEMIFPYAGLTKRAVDEYVECIEKSDLPTEIKVGMVLNARKNIKRIKNQYAIAEIAYNNAKPETDFSGESGVSEDWFERFMDSASFVSSEEMQRIWGKILANEFERPGSTPPNMIRILSEITPELAKAFRIICSMSILILPIYENADAPQNGCRRILAPYNNNDEKFRNIGVSFSMINELETLGVIHFEPVRGYIATGLEGDDIFVRIGNRLEKIEDIKNGELPIGNVMLTSAGEALESITDFIEVSGYYEMAKEYLSNRGVKFAEKHDYYLVEEGDKCALYKRNHQ